MMPPAPVTGIDDQGTVTYLRPLGRVQVSDQKRFNEDFFGSVRSSISHNVDSSICPFDDMLSRALNSS